MLHCLRVLITQTSTELCIMSNPQSNNHVVTGTLNQEDQGVSSQTWHYCNLRLSVIHSYMVVVSVDIFKQTFSRDTATAELCQFQFPFSCYFLTILSKSLSCLRQMCSQAGGTCPLWDLSPRGPCERGPIPPSHRWGNMHFTYLILIALTLEDPISLKFRTHHDLLVHCAHVYTAYASPQWHTPIIPRTVCVLEMKNVKTSDSVKHVSQRGSGWIPVVWRVIGSFKRRMLLYLLLGWQKVVEVIFLAV